jgi:hypothetical protein
VAVLRRAPEQRWIVGARIARIVVVIPGSALPSKEAWRE